MSRFNLACWVINVYSPEEDMPLTAAYPSRDTDKRLLANLPAMLEAVEEDLTKLLPAGYSAKIREWNDDAS